MVKHTVLNRIVVYGGALLVAFVVLAPPLWLLISSISSAAELLSVPVHWIPREPTLERYRQVIFATGSDSAAVFRRSILNSLIVSTSVTAICVVLGSLAAYSFARMPFARHGRLVYVLLVAYMLPPIILVIPLYRIIGTPGLTDTKFGLILIYTSLIMPFAVWILRGFFQTIPAELEAAAMIDGASRMGAFVRIILPLAVPGLVATALFCFLMAWEEFLIALIFTSTGASKTVPVAIAEFKGRHSIDFGMMATGGIIAAIPPVIIAMIFQRYLISGLSSGAVKG